MTGAGWFHCEKGEGGRGIEGTVHVNYIYSNLANLFCVPVYSKFTCEGVATICYVKTIQVYILLLTIKM